MHRSVSMTVPVIEKASLSVGFVDLEKEGSDWLVITTTGQFLDEIIKARVSRKQGSDQGTLGRTKGFKEVAENVEGFAQGFLWVSTDGFTKAMCVGEGKWVGPRMTCSRKCHRTSALTLDHLCTASKSISKVTVNM